MAKRRLFYAISLSEDIKSNIEKILYILQNQSNAEKVRWVSIDNLHLTLHFLGHVEEEKLAVLDQEIASIIQVMPSFTLEFVPQLQFFKGHKYIINLAIEPHPRLIQLAAELKKTTDNLNIPTENRVYKPHITLGRTSIRPHFQLPNSLIDQITKQEINAITLFESSSTEEGVIYTGIKNYALGNIS